MRRIEEVLAQFYNKKNDEYIYFSIRFLSTVNGCMKCINNKGIEIINAYEMT